MRKKGNNFSRFFIRAVGFVFAVFTLVSLVRVQTQIIDKKSQLSELNSQIAVLQRDVDELNDLLANGSREELIEKAAREKLGYVYADEQIYTNLSPDR